MRIFPGASDVRISITPCGHAKTQMPHPTHRAWPFSAKTHAGAPRKRGDVYTRSSGYDTVVFGFTMCSKVTFKPLTIPVPSIGAPRGVGDRVRGGVAWSRQPAGCLLHATPPRTRSPTPDPYAVTT